MMVGMRRRSTAHTVTREQYYAGKRTIVPDAVLPAAPARTPRDALIDADYPRVDLEVAIAAALARLDSG
jgi:hypothetical protein